MLSKELCVQMYRYVVQIYSSHCLITKKSVNTFKHRMEYKGLDPNYTTV